MTFGETHFEKSDVIDREENSEAIYDEQENVQETSNFTNVSEDSDVPHKQDSDTVKSQMDEMDQDLHKEKDEHESTMEISDYDGNLSLVKISGLPDFESCNLNATVCLEKVETKINKDQSKRRRTGKPNCIICKRTFADKNSLKLHISQEHK